MLENKKNGLDNFYKKFLAGTEDSDNIGCIVMNAIRSQKAILH